MSENKFMKFMVDNPGPEEFFEFASSELDILIDRGTDYRTALQVIGVGFTYLATHLYEKSGSGSGITPPPSDQQVFDQQVFDSVVFRLFSSNPQYANDQYMSKEQLDSLYLASEARYSGADQFKLFDMYMDAVIGDNRNFEDVEDVIESISYPEILRCIREIKELTGPALEQEKSEPEMGTEPVTDSYSYSEAGLETNNEAEAELGLPDPVTEADDPLTGSGSTQFELARETFDPLTNPNPGSTSLVNEFGEAGVEALRIGTFEDTTEYRDRIGGGGNYYMDWREDMLEAILMLEGRHGQIGGGGRQDNMDWRENILEYLYQQTQEGFA